MNWFSLIFGNTTKVLDAIQALRSDLDQRLARIETKVDVLGGKIDAISITVNQIRDAVSFPEAERIAFLVSLDGLPAFEVESGGTMNAKVSQVINVHLVAKDKFGNETTLDASAPPVWSGTGDVVVTASADGLSCQIGATGPASAGNLVQVTGDADLGEGVRTITGTLQVDWLPGDAVTIDVAVDSVTDVP